MLFTRREDPFLAALRVLQAQHLELLDRLLESHERQVRSTSAAHEASAAALAAQANAFTAYLESFRVTEPTSSRVMRDEDEYRMWLERTGYQPDPDQLARAKAFAEAPW